MVSLAVLLSDIQLGMLGRDLLDRLASAGWQSSREDKPGAEAGIGGFSSDQEILPAQIRPIADVTGSD